LQTPTFAGSKSNLEAEYQTSGLDVPQQKEVIKWANEFATKWKESPDQPPDVTWYVNRVSPENRVAAITEMLFLEATNLKAQGKQVSVKNYQLLFPEHARQVKSVIRQASGLPLCTSRQIFGLMGLFTIPVALYAFRRLPLDSVRMVFLLLFKVLYRLRVRGLENIPAQGPAILACNHVSFLDGAIPMTVIPRRMRTIAWAGNFNNFLFRKWADFVGVILMTSGPKSIRKGLADAAEALRNGQLVAIFPEGGISRTGQVRTFRPGITKIQEKLDKPVPVIPLYIDEVWGSIFSYVGGKVFSRFPNSLRRPLSVHIGQPVDDPCSMFHIRQAVERLGAESVPYQSAKFKAPAMDFVRQCKKRRFKQKIGDSTGQQATGGALLTRTLVLRRLLDKFVLAHDEHTVGVLIPPSFGGVVVNMALGLDRRVAVNLNYSLSEELINNCLEQAEIKHVLTSRKVMEKFDFKLNAEVFYLDDLQDKVTGLDKAISAFQAFALPTYFLNRWLGLHRICPKELITIVFTSGSTGTPKGVMLSHRNISSNMKAIDQAASFNTNDAMVGILPFFHSFGYTATLWAAMSCNIRGIYHFSPLDPKQVGKLVEKYKGTILVATPTFLRSYMKRCTKEQFASLDIVVAGAERLPPELSDAFEEKFGVRPVEGYGATELSPITSVNIPASRQYDSFQVECREGTVGRPLKSVAAKVTDLDTGVELGPGESGMLWITGPNVMQGYLNMPDKTDEVLVDGWYQTGDVVMLDEDGFITITGRMSRFSKIGGEMVPHVKIEELLTKMVDQTPQDDTDDRPCIAVTAVPHATKGERLIVLHTAINKSVDELRQGLTAAGLPNLFIPNADCFRQVPELPLLGSGKLDLKGIKQMAIDLFTEKTEDSSE
jgi:acyl-[acyl-carrier-protein]-phospholipid O-acyltransferase/long-chain-fatty-acid--[acyl-carrier-protein] ligase